MPVDIEPGARESNPERQPGDAAEGRKVRGSELQDSVGCHECRIGIRRLLIVWRNILSFDWRLRPCIGRPAGPGAWRR